MPSHSVIVTRSTTTTSTSAIVLNTGYFKGIPGILKLLQLLLGIACVAIAGYYVDSCRLQPRYYTGQIDVYFLLVAVTCMITTFLLLFSALISIATASILPKTVFEYLYHFFAFLLYLSAGIAYLAELLKRNDGYYKEQGYDAKMAAAVMGIILAILYLGSFIMGYRVYRIG